MVREETFRPAGHPPPIRTASGKSKSPIRTIVLAFVLVILVGGVFVFMAVYEGRQRTVHLVNGLHRAYTVTIDGEAHSLAPGRPTVVELAEGEHVIHAADLGLPEETVEIRTDFVTRPFREEVIVINPDRVALVLWEETEYMEEVDDTAEYNYELRTNEVLHTFPHIHFAFEAFPEEVEIEESREMRSRVEELEVAPEAFAETVANEMEYEAFIENLKQRFRYAPDNMWYVQFLSVSMEVEAFLEEIRDELDARPVYVEVHRAYQTVMDAARPDHDLEGEYAALLANDPSNADLQYLAGRVKHDRDAALELLRSATESDNAYALGALAFSHLVVGEFDEASRSIDQALALRPAHPSMTETRSIVWLAQGDVSSRLAAEPRDLSGVPTDAANLNTIVLLMGQRGDSVETVHTLVEDYLNKYEQENEPLSPAEKQDVRDALEFTYWYGHGGEEYLARLAASEDPYDRMALALTTGDLASASALAGELELGPVDLSMLYLLAAEHEDDEAAADYLSRVAGQLVNAQDWETRLVGATLSGGESADADRLLGLHIPPASKRTFLALLGVRYPEDRDRYLMLARTMNFERVYPYHVLDAYLTRAGY